MHRPKEELLLRFLTIFFIQLLIFLLRILSVYRMFLSTQIRVIICTIAAVHLCTLCPIPLIIILLFQFHLIHLVICHIPLHLYLPIFLLIGWVLLHRSLLVLLFLISIFLITIRNPHIQLLLHITEFIPQPSRSLPHFILIKRIIICIGFLLLLFLRLLPLFTLFQRLYLQ